MGKFLSREQRFSEALIYFDKTKSCKKNINDMHCFSNCLLFYEYGYVLYKLGKYKESHEAYDIATKIDQNISHSHQLTFVTSKIQKIIKRLRLLHVKNNTLINKFNTNNININNMNNINNNHNNNNNSDNNSTGSNSGSSNDSDGSNNDNSGDISSNNLGFHYSNSMTSNSFSSISTAFNDININLNLNNNVNRSNSTINSSNNSNTSSTNSINTNTVNTINTINTRIGNNNDNNNNNNMVMDDGKNDEDKSSRDINHNIGNNNTNNNNNSSSSNYRMGGDSNGDGIDNKMDNEGSSCCDRRIVEFNRFWNRLLLLSNSKNSYFRKLCELEYNSIGILTVIDKDTLINEIGMNRLHCEMVYQSIKEWRVQREQFLDWLKKLELYQDYHIIFDKLCIFTFEAFYFYFDCQETLYEEFICETKHQLNINSKNNNNSTTITKAREFEIKTICQYLWTNSPRYLRIHDRLLNPMK